jgi:ubiquinone/menaquinone biosynthesis C-methylase UbiE
LTIAALAGSEGEVFGIDPAPEMVDAARRATEHLGFRNAQFEVASADRLPFSRGLTDWGRQHRAQFTKRILGGVRSL